MALDQENSTFEKLRVQLLAEHCGKFALVSGEEIQGIYDTYEAALTAGYLRNGVGKPFMVRKIESTDSAVFNAHLFRPSFACR